MSIKNNLRAGIIFLFLIALLSSGLAAFYLYRLSTDSNAILRDNYDSLVFIKNIDQILDLPYTPSGTQLKIIESNIKSEEKNITEPGEKKLADNLYRDFKTFSNSTNNPKSLVNIRIGMKRSANGIMQVNLIAIKNKNNIADNTAHSAIIMLAVIDSLCFFIVLLFVMRFPEYIAKPIKELTEGIQEIANKNYDKRLLFTSKNEFWRLGQAFNQMAEKLFIYENSSLATIKYEKLRVETIVKNITDGIISFDENAMITSVNPVAVKLLGIEEAEIIGCSAQQAAADNDLFNKFINETEQFSDLKLCLDGKENYFTKELFEVYTPDQEYPFGKNETVSKRIGYFILLKNITRFYKLDEAKTNFIATISHELKTPISSLKMSLKLMEDKRYGTVTKFQKELINNIHDDSDRLLKITSELLDMGQVETGKLLLNFGNTHPQNIIKYTSEAIEFIAKQKEITLNIKCPKGLPEVWADPDKTAWVLINFLSNAIKYSLVRSVVDIIVKKHSSTKIEFSVKDYGKGIEEIYLPRVFERYFKVPGSDFEVTGTGLGLAIAKDFIEAQGGGIGVESKIGEGSRFYFLLPISLI